MINTSRGEIMTITIILIKFVGDQCGSLSLVMPLGDLAKV